MLTRVSRAGGFALKLSNGAREELVAVDGTPMENNSSVSTEGTARAPAPRSTRLTMLVLPPVSKPSLSGRPLRPGRSRAISTAQDS